MLYHMAERNLGCALRGPRLGHAEANRNVMKHSCLECSRRLASAIANLAADRRIGCMVAPIDRCTVCAPGANKGAARDSV